MSVASEILRIQHNIADAYSKVAEKGGTVPLRPTSAVLAESIMSIPQNGPDGNPVGTIISFMGLAAPSGYLVCDGAEYGISEYPALAALFQQQFGTSGHFGGDGEATFAVPDLRNLFLRGYHGEVEEQLSGEVGARQEATVYQGPYGQIGGDGAYGVVTNFPIDFEEGVRLSVNADKYESALFFKQGVIKSAGTDIYNPHSQPMPTGYTSRPVNMAVLYCIKAVESASCGNSAGEVYSTEETRIGTWADGKPLYRKVIYFNLPDKTSSAASYSGIDLPENSVLVKYEGLCETTAGIKLALYAAGYSYVSFGANGQIFSMAAVNSYTSAKVTLVVEYTKTTDLATKEA